MGVLLPCALFAQIASPKLLAIGQPDSTDLKRFTASIFAQSHAVTPREKAEAIWRFFLTDGRFAKSDFWYHIAGWSYEEPWGEVLDPMKLLNSYGFGLCYHIAPLLEAMFDAGGFADARCWFLTGHTVAEVFYEGSYHYFDSDMMGYNYAGDGSYKGKSIASVRDLERHPEIILGKLSSPDSVKPGTVDNPWYPADVRAGAMQDLAALFSTAANNYLYPYTRYAVGHSMDFTLRPGEKLIRYFSPEEKNLYYLPYKYDGKQWTEFPQEFAEWNIKTADGPRSQKDSRLWATGRLEYAPTLDPSERLTVIDMPSPYVIIDAHFSLSVQLASSDSEVLIETSTDGGHSWVSAAKRNGPFTGTWTAEPAVIVRTAHGRLTAVSGTYGYKVRITRSGAASVSAVSLVSRIQVNPRSLPAVHPGVNRFTYSSAEPVERTSVPVPPQTALLRHLQCITESGQALLVPEEGQTGEAIYELSAKQAALTGFDAGARFLDMPDGLAPDKLTAEVRRSSVRTKLGEVSLSWSHSLNGPFAELWRWDKQMIWRDGDPIDRMLLWPEVFRSVRGLNVGDTRVYVRLRSSGPAIDNIRLATYSQLPQPKGRIAINQLWLEDGVSHEHTEHLAAGVRTHDFSLSAGPDIQNISVTLTAEPTLP